MPIYSSKIM